MAKVRQVALAFPLAPPHLVRLVHGISDYARERGNWVISPNPDTYRMSVGALRDWPGDGIIAMVETMTEVRAAREIGLPVVNLSARLREAGLPRVMVDHRTIGRLAAEHLLDCGFRRFGYYGSRGPWFSQLRRQGFIERISRQGGLYSLLEVSSGIGKRRPWMDWFEPLKQWLKTLKTPVGIMADFDVRAGMVIEACGRLGLRVPDDVAVIGVDNHEINCEFCQVPLSSVSRSGQEVGYRAAALLDQLMEGKRPPDGDILIPPDGVVQRRSTDVVAVEDPHVVAAVQFIREHVGEPFGVEALLPLVPVSRRWLEHRFKQCLGLTPHEYICRTRVQRAKQLLTDPKELPLGQIAQACGFSETRHFRAIFERLTGATPAAYRRSHHAAGSGRVGQSRHPGQ